MNRTSVATYVQTFCWGEVKDVVRFGDLAVIEYYDLHDDMMRYHPLQIRQEDQQVCDFSVSCTSLDEAVAYAIAYKYEGINSRAGGYFCKMIGMYDKEEA